MPKASNTSLNASNTIRSRRVSKLQNIFNYQSSNKKHEESILLTDNNEPVHLKEASVDQQEEDFIDQIRRRYLQQQQIENAYKQRILSKKSKNSYINISSKERQQHNVKQTDLKQSQEEAASHTNQTSDMSPDQKSFRAKLKQSDYVNLSFSINDGIKDSQQPKSKSLKKALRSNKVSKQPQTGLGEQSSVQTKVLQQSQEEQFNPDHTGIMFNTQLIEQGMVQDKFLTIIDENKLSIPAENYNPSSCIQLKGGVMLTESKITFDGGQYNQNNPEKLNFSDYMKKSKMQKYANNFEKDQETGNVIQSKEIILRQSQEQLLDRDAIYLPRLEKNTNNFYHQEALTIDYNLVNSGSYVYSNNFNSSVNIQSQRESRISTRRLMNRQARNSIVVSGDKSFVTDSKKYSLNQSVNYLESLKSIDQIRNMHPLPQVLSNQTINNSLSSQILFENHSSNKYSEFMILNQKLRKLNRLRPTGKEQSRLSLQFSSQALDQGEREQRNLNRNILSGMQNSSLSLISMKEQTNINELQLGNNYNQREKRHSQQFQSLKSSDNNRALLDLTSSNKKIPINLISTAGSKLEKRIRVSNKMMLLIQSQQQQNSSKNRQNALRWKVNNL